MEAINVAVASMAGLALVVSLFTYWIRRHWINEPLLALVLGVLIGPAGLGWLDLAAYGGEREIIEVTARFTLAIALVGVGLEVRGYLSTHWRSLAVLVLGGTALMWGASSLLVGWILGLGVLPALLIGAVLAPIDPILAAAVATGRVARENLPERTRHLLSAESGVRHGLGLLWVLLPALLLTKPAAGRPQAHRYRAARQNHPRGGQCWPGDHPGQGPEGAHRHPQLEGLPRRQELPAAAPRRGGPVSLPDEVQEADRPPLD